MARMFHMLGVTLCCLLDACPVFVAGTGREISSLYIDKPGILTPIFHRTSGVHVRIVQHACVEGRGMARACVVQRLYFKRAFGGNYMIRHRRCCQLQKAEAPLVLPESLLVVALAPGSNLLPEPRVILDAGSLIAMVVKEVMVISGPLFGGALAIVQLVSLLVGHKKGMTIA